MPNSIWLTQNKVNSILNILCLTMLSQYILITSQHIHIMVSIWGGWFLCVWTCVSSSIWDSYAFLLTHFLFECLVILWFLCFYITWFYCGCLDIYWFSDSWWKGYVTGLKGIWVETPSRERKNHYQKLFYEKNLFSRKEHVHLEKFLYR